MSKTQAKRPATQSTPAQSAQTTISMSPADLEALIRRVVREEINRLVEATKPAILNDWSQEGPDDPEGDADLLKEALEAIHQRELEGDTSVSWEDFEAELRRAEAAGELPD
jgi:hypothetical protein